jgi:hypothetical protein
VAIAVRGYDGRTDLRKREVEDAETENVSWRKRSTFPPFEKRKGGAASVVDAGTKRVGQPVSCCIALKDQNHYDISGKFRNLIEIREEQVTIPDFVWLAYAVCATDEDSCSWGGWIIESAWKIVEGDPREVEVESDIEQGCPVCGKLLYRTEVEKCFRLDPNAEPKLDYSYESAPLSFKKSER